MLPWIRLKMSVRKSTALVCLAVAFVFLFSFFSVFLSSTVSAQSEEFGVTEVGEEINIPTVDTDIRVLIVRIINIFLGFLGLIAVCIMLYAGYLIMTSGGNEEQVGAGKKLLINGLIGFIIIISAFTISMFILRALRNSLNGVSENPPGEEAPIPAQTYNLTGSLGKVIKDHYPLRGAKNIPRNTSIIVTFGLPVDPATIIENTNRTCWNATNTGPMVQCEVQNGAIVNPYYGDCIDLDSNGSISFEQECDTLKKENVVINTSASFSEDSIPVTGISASALATYDEEKKAFVFVFRPHQYLGSPNEDVAHRVFLTTNIKRSDISQGLFSDQFRDGYAWEFTTSNKLDLDPPHVVDVYPKQDETVPKNSIFQIVFSEAMDPTVTQGIVRLPGSDFSSAIVNRSTVDTANPVFGTWTLSNGYTTLEFTPTEECGLNSCGEQMFCLPVTCEGTGTSCTNPYETLLRTAQPTGNESAPFEAVPFSGIYDVAFNGLDNISDNTGVTPELKKPTVSSDPLRILTSEKVPDNYSWSFLVQNLVDKRAPYIESITPGVDAEDVPPNSPVHINFSMRMKSDTLSDIKLEEYPSEVCADGSLSCDTDDRLDPLWYRVWSFTSFQTGKTQTHLDHRDFGPRNLDLYYFPSIPSSVKSITQNCAYPGYGPWEPTPVPQNQPSTCVVTYDANGNVVNAEGCVGVNFVATTDTGCLYTLGSSQFVLQPNDTSLLQPTVDKCLEFLHEKSPSAYSPVQP